MTRMGQDTMVTKGVASVRSPVCNLQQFGSQISHDAFSNAVIDAFREEYGVDQEVCVHQTISSLIICSKVWQPFHVEENEETRRVDYIRDGMAELPVSYQAFEF